MLDIVQHVGFPGNVATHRGEALTERAHDNIDLIFQAEVSRCATSARTKHANAVRIVYHDSCAIFLADRHDLWQGGNVAAHAVHAIDDDEFPGCVWQAGEDSFQAAHIVVA